MIALLNTTGWEWVGGAAILLVGLALVKGKEAEERAEEALYRKQELDEHRRRNDIAKAREHYERGRLDGIAEAEKKARKEGGSDE